MKTTLAIALLVSGLFVTAAYAGSCTQNCYRIGNQVTCNSYCY